VRGCIRAYTHMNYFVDVSPGVGRTPGVPEESRSTKAQYTCRPYGCTQYICFFFVLSTFCSFFPPSLSTLFFVCVCACVCVSRMYVRAYLAIPCVSAKDNVKHTQSNIRYDNEINKMKQM